MSLSQGTMSIERMCRLARVSRAGYYRFWRAHAPRQHDTQVRDAIQRLALANGRHRGYPILQRCRESVVGGTKDRCLRHKRLSSRISR